VFCDFSDLFVELWVGVLVLMFGSSFDFAPPLTLSLEDASKRLERIVLNNGMYITRFDSCALEPVVYEALAHTVNDYGASNDILFVAELVEKYNDGGSVEKLREALLILNDIRERNI